MVYPIKICHIQNKTSQMEGLWRLFKELYDYIEPFNTGWKKQLKPASRQLINKFIKLSRMKEYADRIPLSYFEFLERLAIYEKEIEFKGGRYSQRQKDVNSIRCIGYCSGQAFL